MCGIAEASNISCQREGKQVTHHPSKAGKNARGRGAGEALDAGWRPQGRRGLLPAGEGFWGCFGLKVRPGRTRYHIG